MRIQWQGAQRRAFLILATVCFVAVGCGGSSNPGTTTAKTPFKVGVLYDQSQTYKTLGQPALAGLRASIDAINKKGGVNGHTIELDVQDDRSDVATARTAYNQLASDGAVVVVGPVASATLTPVAPLASQLKVPNLTLAALSSMHRPAQPYLFTAGLFVGDSAKIDTSWMAAQAKVKGLSKPRVAALSLDTPAVAEFRAGLTQYVPTQTGGQLIRNDVVAVNASDMNSVALAIIGANPDFVPVGLLSSQIPGFVGALRNHGVNAPVINYFVGSDEATFKAANDPGYYAVRQYAEPSEQNVPGLTQMAADAKAAGVDGQMTNAWFTYGYVQGLIVIEALKHCGDSCDGTKMRDALESIKSLNTNGLSGNLGVTSTDHMFVKYGRVFGYDTATKTTKPQGDWISANSVK
jgi:branched-chain amino acid transport system substrate-binding protein